MTHTDALENIYNFWFIVWISQYRTLPQLGDISVDRATLFHIRIHFDFQSSKMLLNQVIISGSFKNLSKGCGIFDLHIVFY